MLRNLHSLATFYVQLGNERDRRCGHPPMYSLIRIVQKKVQISYWSYIEHTETAGLADSLPGFVSSFKVLPEIGRQTLGTLTFFV